MLTCAHCDFEFEYGERIIVLIEGEYGISDKSGRGTIVNEQQMECYHLPCLIQTLLESDGQEMDEARAALYEGLMEDIRPDIEESLRDEIREEILEELGLRDPVVA